MNEPLPITGLQRSVAWLLERCGHATASRAKDIVAKLANGKPAKARDDYLWEVVIERLTGNPTDHFANAAMQWGVEQEAFARMRYEAATGHIVEEVGFVKHPTIDWFGGSADGFIGDDGGWEAKCPYNSAVHLRTILDGMPPEHMPQIQSLMAITGRKWWAFTSFDPRMPPPLDLHIQRVERDEEYIGKLAAAVAVFLADVETIIARLRPAKPPLIQKAEERFAQAIAAHQESAPQEAPVSVSDGTKVAGAAPADDSAYPPADADYGDTPAPPDDAPTAAFITPDQAITLETLCQDAGITLAKFKAAAKVERLSQITADRYDGAIAWIRKNAKGE